MTIKIRFWFQFTVLGKYLCVGFVLVLNRVKNVHVSDGKVYFAKWVQEWDDIVKKIKKLKNTSS